MNKKRRWVAGLLATILVLSPVAGISVFGAGLGDKLHDQSLMIADEALLANGVYWNSGYNDKITENYIEYSPGGTVVPVVSYGNDIYGAASFKAVAQKLGNEGKHVVAGLNGDYFTMSNGVAIGMTIVDGLLRTSESGQNPSIGFYEDGTAIIGRAGLNIRVDGPALGTGVGSIHLNKVVSTTSGVMLYTTDFADDDTNKATIPTYNIILNIESGEPTINGTVTATVDSAFQSIGAAQIPEEKMMLSIASATEYPGTLAKVAALKPGDPVVLTFAANEAWDDVVYAVGGGEKLITAGEKVITNNNEINPRTAIGIKNDGSLIYYTVDGRQEGHSKGATLSQLADRLLELGCVEALNMDGGGSTAIHSVYPGDSELTTVNMPSQGFLRNCANYIVLINTASPTGSLSHIHLYPYSVQMLAGASQIFTVKATDDNYYPVTTPSSFSYSATNDLGSFDDEGIFTAGASDKSGKVTIKVNSRISNTGDVRVVSKPDSITIHNQSNGQAVPFVSVTAGEEIDFTAKAMYKKMPLVAQDECFTWTLQGDIGTIDEQGKFTAGNITKASGTITATAGGTTASVTVNVVSEGQRLETFENEDHMLAGISEPGLAVSLNEDLTKVRYGYKSAEIDYSFEEAERQLLNMPLSLDFSKTPYSLSFWIYGDDSDNTLNLVFDTVTGEQEVIGTTLDFASWKQVVLQVPEGSTGLKGIRLMATGSHEGTIYLDQFISGIGYYVDTQPPVIDISLIGAEFTAVINDDVDADIGASDISLTYDGEVLNFAYNSASKTLSSTLPATDGYPHRLTLCVSDESGNLARKSLAIAAGEDMEQPFIDMDKHWAKDNTFYLYNHGIVNGIETENGFKYNPDKNITRAEFAVLMSNWLVEDMEQFENVELPFEDSALIPQWALNGAKTMYGMGIIQGVGVEGKIYFNPTNPISREEVMTIIGRTQARGYGEADLNSFGDGSKVSAWALPYVKTLVFQGIISGYDGNLWPKNPVTRAQVSTIISGLM